MNKKNSIVGIKLTAEEKKKLKQRAYSNMQNMSEYIRTKTLNDEE